MRATHYTQTYLFSLTYAARIYLVQLTLSYMYVSRIAVVYYLILCGNVLN